MTEVEVLQRRLDRERRSRQEAERLLEEKSREVYEANITLQLLNDRFREQAERTQAIVDHAVEGIVTIDGSGAIESANPAAQRIFGCSADALVGKPAIELFSHPCREGEGDLDVCTPNWIALDTVEVGREVLGKRVDGSEFPMEWTVSQVNFNGRLTHMGLIRDLSRRKQLETQLSHAQRMESVGQLAAGIAHEINTPIQYMGDNARFLDDAFRDLNAYFQSVDELVRACEQGCPEQVLLDRIKQTAAEADLEYLRDEVPLAIRHSLDGADRVATIVRAMKEFSHPGHREKAAIDLNQAIKSTITVSRNEWKYVSVVETAFDPGLPLVPCYAGDLNQALLNLIVNAAHAIEATRGNEEQPRGTIRISTSHEQGWAEIRVADTGTGIAPEVQSKVYDPFFTTKPLGKGTGQGLAIAYSVVVEKHGGTIRFETEVGRGTTFIVRLPLK